MFSSFLKKIIALEYSKQILLSSKLSKLGQITSVYI